MFDFLLRHEAIFKEVSREKGVEIREMNLVKAENPLQNTAFEAPIPKNRPRGPN